MSAILYFIDGRKKVVTSEVGRNIWQALNGEVEPTEAQAVFLPHIQDVFLNRHNPLTPDSYLKAHRRIISELVSPGSVKRIKPDSASKDGSQNVNQVDNWYK